MAIGAKLDFKKIFFLLLLIILVAISGLLAIDFVGKKFGLSVNLPGMSLFKNVSIKKKIQRSENKYLLEREELDKKQNSIILQQEVLANHKNEIIAMEKEVEKKFELLSERENGLDQKEKMLESRENEYNNREQNIREQAAKLYNMPPNDAVALLEKQSEPDVVSILRAIDSYSEELGVQSTSPYLLKLLGDINKDMAANVLRKFQYIADGDGQSGVDILEDFDENDIPNP